MSMATLTSKGQVTIPLDVRTALGLSTGDRLTFIAKADGTYIMAPASRSVRALKGVLAARDTPVSLEEMDMAIADSASGA